ncbi:NAC domain-containing 72-like [Olea europaea subsp. europaea]|uniref:NAC domain-containing 72-like n=1 Tax=Olea europaea subsp. europaea TaxID=158383 RepID=A0A8S0RY23_OLEEU|nr:NAC domain-containing 72-like [Olea europaea subsp. europaea]
MAAQESSNFHVEETIPPGYQFMPTDEELLHYLNLKILNKRISTDAIKDVDLYKYHPSDLCQSATSGTRECYFFTSRTRKYHKGSRPDRTAADGYWKATGGDIIVQSKGQEVGRKKVLVYYERKSDNNNKGTKTNWIMHKFTIHKMKDVACSSTNAIPDDKTLDKCVCRIYYRTSKSCKNVEQETQRNMILIQETDVPDANLEAASFYHHHNPALAFDQSSLHGAYLPDPQASINDQYQLVHEPVTYTHGEVAMQLQSNILQSPQPLAHIPGDQYYPSIPPETGIQSNDKYNPLIPPETSVQSTDQYQPITHINGDYGDFLDITTPYFSSLFGFLQPLDDNIMDPLLGDSSNAQLESLPIPLGQSITQTHGVVGGSGASNFAASTEDFYLPSPPIEWPE